MTSHQNLANSIISQDVSISKIEIFDVSMAKYISSLDGIDNEDKKKVKKMVKEKFEGNKVQIHYQLAGKAKSEFSGRFVPKPFYGLQTLSRDIRNALGKNFYWDVDISNCQPDILRQMAEKNGWKNNALTELCKNRDTLFENFKIENNLDRDACKRMFISLLFGGDIYNGYPKWVRTIFYPEVKVIMDNVCNLYKDLFNKISKSKSTLNPRGSCCALVMQTEERKCLMALDRFLTSHDRYLAVLIHDGGYVEKLKDEIEFPDHLLRGAELFIKNDTGYDIKLVLKPIITTFKLPGIPEVTEGEDYNSVKLQFERNNFKCISESSFYNDEDEKILTRTENKLQVSYKNVLYHEYDEKQGIVPKSFINKWLYDPNQRMYKFTELCIPPRILKNNCYNLWKGLAIRNNHSKTCDPDDLQMVFDHIKRLCNNEDCQYDYVLKWIAFMLQKPGERNNIAILFKSIPGLGKDILFDFLAAIIGNDFCQKIKNIARDAFEQYNPLLSFKILVLFNEIKRKDGVSFSEEIKNLITEEDIKISRKNIDVVSQPNHIHLLFFSNKEFPLEIDENDRRFNTIDSKVEPPSKEIMDKLRSVLKDPSVQKMFYNEMIKIDVSKVDWIKDRPVSQLTKDIQVLSRPRELNFMIGYILERSDKIEHKISSKDLFNEFMTCMRNGDSNYCSNNIKFGILLRKFNIDGLTNSSNGMIKIFDIKKCISWLIKEGYHKEDVEKLLHPKEEGNPQGYLEEKEDVKELPKKVENKDNDSDDDDWKNQPHPLHKS